MRQEPMKDADFSVKHGKQLKAARTMLRVLLILAVVIALTGFHVVWLSYRINQSMTNPLATRGAIAVTLLVCFIVIAILLLRSVYAQTSTYRLSLEKTNRELVDANNRAEEMARKADQANKAKSEFLAAMSHEIRTPMNGIIGMTGLLWDTNLNTEQREYATVIKSSGEALLSLINDILDFSKIEAGKLEIETIDFHLRVAIEDSMDILDFKAKEKKLTLTNEMAPDVYPHVRGDPGRLRQILINLVGNAIKFTNKGGITLTTSMVAGTDTHETIRFAISDTGIGIASDKLAGLFTPFAQVDSSTTRRFGGTGLGLSISKRLAEMMGGVIGVESVEGKGSTFWFELPFGKRQEGELETVMPMVSLSGLKVLIADDDEANVLLLMSLLKSWGCHIVRAESGGAIRVHLDQAVIAGKPFDVALIADTLVNGSEANPPRMVIGEPLFKDTKFLLVHSSVFSVGTALPTGSGYSGFLPKPISQSQLRDSLVQVVGSTGRIDWAESSFIPVQLDQRKPGCRILLAEDNATNQLVATRILEKLGYKVDTARNGREALDALASSSYDLVLMDCQMPDMDGFEATRNIRRSESQGSHIPVIAMTANALHGDSIACLAAGMDDYLSKPVEPRKLAETLDRWLSAKPAHTYVDGDEPTILETIEDPVGQAGQSTVEDVGVTFDREGFLSRVLGDMELAQELVQAFLMDMPVQMQALEKAILSGDAEQAMRQAHRIRGAAANMGGEALKSTAASMESAAKCADFNQLKLLLPTLSRQYRTLGDALSILG